MCAFPFFFPSFFATFDFTLLINKMLYLKNYKSLILLKIGRHFGKLLFKINSKNFKQSFLRYIENATGSVRNFAKCI